MNDAEIGGAAPTSTRSNLQILKTKVTSLSEESLLNDKIIESYT